MKITVYHGATQIVEAPICKFGRKHLDFGQGFYLTDIKEQATQWARTIADKRGEKPLVNVYQLDRDAILSEGNCKIFTAYNQEWLDFIVGNRKGQNPAMEYDYVEGGIANDRVIDTIRLYMTGFYSAELTLQQLAYYKPNNQICILNQELLLKHLKYERTEEIS